MKKYKIIDSEYFLPMTVAIGVMLRFFVTCMWYNHDFESYTIVGEIVSRGGNVYAETSRYNYGPLFSFIQGLLWLFSSGVSSMTSSDIISCYRMCMVMFLSLADVGLMFYVRKKTNNLFAAVFFLNPISVIITGYHNQFDNWAVLLALLGVEFMKKGNSDEKVIGWNKNDTFGVLFLTLSLIVKHILYAFPIWILFSKKLKKKKIAYCVFPPFLFLLSFVPFIKLGWTGILQNVFLYRSFNNFPIFGVNIIKYFVPEWAGINHAIVFFAIFMVVVGWMAGKREVDDLLLIYFIAVVCFSSAIANQYIAIPAVAVTIFMRHKSHIYWVAGGIYLLLNTEGLHSYSFIEALCRDNGICEKFFWGLSSGMVMYSVLSWILLFYLIDIRIFRKEERKSIAEFEH